MPARPKPTLRGLIPPMITPLTTDGEVDVPAVHRLVQHLVAGGVDGLFVLGTSGEGPWLTAAQRRRLVAETVRAVDGHVPVLAGVLEASTCRTLEAVELVTEAGADAIVITSQYYLNVSADDQIRHVQAVARATPLPLVLYNIPSSTHNALLPDTVQRLLQIDSVVAMKDSAGNWDDFQRLLELRRLKPGFTVLQGNEAMMARSLLAGADGIVPGVGNLIPDVFARMLACAAQGDHEGALSLQAQVDGVRELQSRGFWLACLKYAASLLGFGSGRTCAASENLSSSDKRAIQQLLEAYGVTATQSWKGGAERIRERA